MRSRNIKPGFFKNEELAALPPLTRILFIGLWCMADREGRLEERARRLKAEIFPYEAANITDMLEALASSPERFIIRYEVAGRLLIWIPSFLDHQKPHYKEARSDLPPYTGPITPPASNLGDGPEKSGPDAAPSIIGLSSANDSSMIGLPSVNAGPLIPDSGFLIPDSDDGPMMEPVENSTASELAAWAAKRVAGWEERETDPGFFAGLLEVWSDGQLRTVLGAMGEASGKRAIRDPRRYLRSSLERQYPARQAPASSVTLAPEPEISDEDRAEAARILREASLGKFTTCLSEASPEEMALALTDPGDDFRSIGLEAAS